MKKLVVLALLLTVGMSFGQSDYLLKNFDKIKNDYKITDDNTILYERVIETKYTTKESYDKLIDILTTDKTPYTVFKDLLPNSDFSKLTLKGVSRSGVDYNYNNVKTFFDAVFSIKNNKVKISIIPTKHLVNRKADDQNIINQYPFAEKDIELKKVKKKNQKISRFIECNKAIKELMWRIDDLITNQSNITY
jgi:hypothetical protein